MISAANLAKKTGLDRREIQFLGDNKVLKAIEGTGPGTNAPRLFEETEIEIACILARSPKMSHRTLSRLAMEARAFRTNCYKSPKGRNFWEKAQDGKQVALGVLLRRHGLLPDIILPEIYPICTDEEAAAFIFKTLKETDRSNIAFVVDLTDALSYDTNPCE